MGTLLTLGLGVFIGWCVPEPDFVQPLVEKIKAKIAASVKKETDSSEE